MTHFFFMAFGVVAGCGLCILLAWRPRQPAEPVNSLTAYCIPARGHNLTGAYQNAEREIESARQIQADLEAEIEGYRAEIDALQTALRNADAANSKLRQQLQKQPVQTAVVERTNRFEFLEIKGGER